MVQQRHQKPFLIFGRVNFDRELMIQFKSQREKRFGKPQIDCKGENFGVHYSFDECVCVRLKFIGNSKISLSFNFAFRFSSSLNGSSGRNNSVHVQHYFLSILLSPLLVAAFVKKRFTKETNKIFSVMEETLWLLTDFVIFPAHLDNCRDLNASSLSASMSMYEFKWRIICEFINATWIQTNEKGECS